MKNPTVKEEGTEGKDGTSPTSHKWLSWSKPLKPTLTGEEHSPHFLSQMESGSQGFYLKGNYSKTSGHIICDMSKGNKLQVSQCPKHIQCMYIHTVSAMYILNSHVKITSPWVINKRDVYVETTRFSPQGSTAITWSVMWCCSTCVGVIITHSIYQRRQSHNSQWWRIIPHQSWLRHQIACPRRRESSSVGSSVCTLWYCNDTLRVCGQQGHGWMDGWWLIKKKEKKKNSTV